MYSMDTNKRGQYGRSFDLAGGISRLCPCLLNEGELAFKLEMVSCAITLR